MAAAVEVLGRPAPTGQAGLLYMAALAAMQHQERVALVLLPLAVVLVGLMMATVATALLVVLL